MAKHRLVTRSDFDGLICAVLLKELDLIEDVTFVHPRDMQHGLVPVTGNDITTNLPYVSGVHLAFDHHESEMTRVGGHAPNHIIDPHAPSAARVVYEHFGGKDRFPNIPDEMLEAVDRADSAQFSKEDILDPSGWVLLSYLMDARTGLGRFRDFRISNYQLMMQLIDHCLEYSVSQILDLPDVKERVDLYRSHEQSFAEQLVRCATVHDNLVVLDLRDEEIIYAGNRFVVYALFPGCNISMHVLWGLRRQNTVFAVGKSVLDRSSRTDVGSLMLAYGGGGHTAAGTCQIPNNDANRILTQLIARITTDG